LVAARHGIFHRQARFQIDPGVDFEEILLNFHQQMAQFKDFAYTRELHPFL
jgi:hypothetical protein